MWRIILSVCTILSVIFVIACSGDQQSGSKNTVETQTENAASLDVENGNAVCPVCKMEMDKSEMITHVAEGDTIYFCAEGCKKHYLAQAEKTEAN